MKNLGFLILAIFVSAAAARAQEAPRGDVSVGYSYLREGFSGGANTHGGSVSGAGYFNGWLGIVGDFGVYHLSQSGTSANTFTVLAGPRFSANRRSSVSPFVQALVGADRLTVSGFGSTHGFSWSTGGGVDLAVSRHIAIRPQFDYIGLRFSNGTTHSARASINVVFRFGGR
ncbi:MAG TPA: outer membrane beta-barrel protein [Candidatus Acidoferrum sp.]